MNISVWLTYSNVSCFHFKEKQKIRLEESIKNLHVEIYQDSTAFKKSLPDADIALVWVFKQEWLKLAPKLKWIATPAAGRDYFQLHLPENILLTYGSFHGRIMAETVIGMILSASRGILDSYKIQNQNGEEWPRQELGQKIRRVAGSQVTILGFGSIGYQIARLLKPFQVKIIGIKRKLIEKPVFFAEHDEIMTIDKLDSILPKTDHLVLVLPRDASTDDIINKKRLDLLPEHSYIYNIGRGNSIDEEALMIALNADKIAGAYLDVFKNEPLSLSSPLRQCKNIFIMPHASAISPDYMDLFVEEFVARYNEWRGQIVE